jgi:hypothetical protein
MSITSLEEIESSLTPEGGQAQTEGQTDGGQAAAEGAQAQPASGTEDIEKIVQERINQLKESGEYIDKSTYEQKLAEKELKNDLLKQLAELDGGKGKVTKDFLKEYLKDYDSIDIKKRENAVALAKEKLVKSRNLDEELAQMELESKYNLLFDEDADTESREYIRQSKLLEREAAMFLEEKKKEQQSLALKDPASLDLEQVKKQVFEDLSKTQAAKQQEIESAWKDYGAKLSTKIDKEVYEVDGHQFEINYTAEEKAQIATLVANAPKIIETFFDTVDGEKRLNEDKFTKFVTRTLFSDKIITSVVKDAIVIGEENRLKNTKNATTNQNSQPPARNDKDTEDLLAKYGIVV